MEHFFNRKPTKGYLDYIKDLQKSTDTLDLNEPEVPEHISKAACYIEDAYDGRLNNGKGTMSETSKKIQLFFFIQTHKWWNVSVYLSVFLISVLVICEPPSSAAITVCNDNLFSFSNDHPVCSKDITFAWEPWTLLVEFILILVFVTDVLMKQAYMKPFVYWTKKWHKISGFFILMFSVDWMIFLLTWSINGSGIRFSRPFRPLLLLTRYRELRRILETLLSMKKNLLRQCLIIILYILLFAWVGVVLYRQTYNFTTECIDSSNSTILNNLENNPAYCEDNICWDRNKFPFCVCTTHDPESNNINSADNLMEKYTTGCDNKLLHYSEPYLPENYVVFHGSFDNIFYGTVRLMVHLSTENFPDFILPAYKKESFNFVYFFLFLFIGVFLLLSVLLAVIVEFWLTYLKKTNDNEKLKERQGIAKAFTCIDYEKNYCIDQKSWNQLILILKKDFSEIQSQFMFDMLDLEESGSLDILDFLNITEALKLQYDLRNATTSIENTKIGVIARRIIGFKVNISFYGLINSRTINMKTIGKLVLVSHSILAISCTLNISESMITTIRIFNSFLLTLMTTEQLLRLLAKGRAFFRSLTNRWDFSIVAISMLSMITFWTISLLIPTKKNQKTVARDICQIIWEVLIVIRPGISGNILVFFYKLINVLSELFLFILVIVYVYMVIGLELFAVASNEPEDNYFEQYGCGLGFKRPSCAFFTLIQQITSSNWHEMMNSVTAASGVWAYFYFCMFYITINLVLLDLTIAMTIEMYNAIKFQYFNKPKSGTGSEENEGVIFEVEEERLRDGSLLDCNTSRKESWSLGWRHIQVAHCTSGSWRKSVLSTEKEAGKVSPEELDKVQKFLEKVEIEHGKLRGRPYLGAKDRDIINVKQLYEEKLSDGRNRENPECILHFWYPLLDWKEKEVGEVLLELKDHHTHEASIKLNFNSETRPVSGRVMSGDDLYTENITFLSREEIETPAWDYHGFQSTNWTVKKSQRGQLKKDDVRVEVLLYDKNMGQISQKKAQKLTLTAHITGYEKSRKRWEENQKEIKQIKKMLGNISYLIQRNAYRVSPKTDYQNSLFNKNDAEGNYISLQDNRLIYKIKKRNSERVLSKAEKAWNKCLNLGRSTWGRSRSKSGAGKYSGQLRSYPSLATSLLLEGRWDTDTTSTMVTLTETEKSFRGPDEDEIISDNSEQTDDSTSDGENQDETKKAKSKKKRLKNENIKRLIISRLNNLKIKQLNSSSRRLTPTSLQLPLTNESSSTPTSAKSCKDFKMFIKEGQPDYDKLVKTSSLPTTPISKSKFLGSFGKSIQGKGTKSEDSSLITFIRSPRISWQKDRNNDDGGLIKSGRLERKQGVKRELLELPEITVSLTGSKNDGQHSTRSSAIFTIEDNDDIQEDEPDL